MPTSHTLTGDLSDVVGTGFPRDSVWVTIKTNLGDNPVFDSAGEQIRFPRHRFALPRNAQFSKSLWSTAALTNPTGYQYGVEVEWPDGAGGTGKKRWFSGWFSLTADKDMSELDYGPMVPPEYYPELTVARDEAVAAKTDAAAAQAAAEAAQAAAEAVGNTNDTIIAGRINDPASATASALTASYLGKTGIQSVTGRFVAKADTPTGWGLEVQPHASQNGPVAKIGGSIAIYSATRNTTNRIEQDPYNGVRISSDNGSNTLAIRNKSADNYSVSAVVFWDNGSENDGNGRERMAIGFANGVSNGIFSRCTFLETSNDPAIGSLLDPPTTFKLIQTGYLNGLYKPRARMVMDDQGMLTFNDVQEVGQLQIPHTGPQVSVLTRLVVGASTAPTAKLEVHGATGVGMKIRDTTASSNTFLTQEASFFQINSPNGFKVISGGAARIEAAAAGAYKVYDANGTTKRIEIAAAGKTYLYDSTGASVIELGGGVDTLVSGDVRFSANIGIGDNAVDPAKRLDLRGPTSQGIKLTDTTLGTSSFITFEASSTLTVNAAGAVALRASGGSDVIKVGGNTLGFYNQTPVARQSVAAAATDAATTQALVNDIRSKLITLGLLS